MGNILGNKIPIVSFNYIEEHIKDDNYILINTLDIENQEYLIKNTINHIDEPSIINKLNKRNNVIVYGKNCRDYSPYYKYNQLKKLGYENVYVYNGGLFEWSILQEIFGDDNFETTSKCKDILLYK